MNTEDEKPRREFALEDFKLDPISSLETLKRGLIIDEDILSLNDAPPVSVKINEVAEPAADAALDAEENELAEPADPIFKELSEPKLPELARENRARLQMQSPNKIYFYWSFKQNPFQTLNRIIGNKTNYQLIVKLINQTNDREELFPADAEGSAWFDVDADSTYLAEIGFYAVNRPFVRLLFSNQIETPRKNPSPRRDYAPNFTVSADQFAEVLDVSGFPQDAFEVALAGDDIEFAEHATRDAFSQIIGEEKSDYDANQSGEIRFVLLALASGYSVEALRGHISPRLFAVLAGGSAEELNAEKALAALQKNFGVSANETFEEESFGAASFGASLINFPRFSKRRTLAKFSPISSLAGKYF